MPEYNWTPSKSESEYDDWRKTLSGMLEAREKSNYKSFIVHKTINLKNELTNKANNTKVDDMREHDLTLYAEETQRVIRHALQILHKHGLGYLFGEFAQHEFRTLHHGNTTYENQFMGEVRFWCKAPVAHIINQLIKAGYQVDQYSSWNLLSTDNGKDVANKAQFRVTTSAGFCFDLYLYSPLAAKDPWEFMKDLDVNKVYWNQKGLEYEVAPGLTVEEVRNQISDGKYLCDIGTPKSRITGLMQYGKYSLEYKGVDKEDSKTYNTETKDEPETKENIMTEQNSAIDFAKQCLHDGMWRSVGDNTVTHAKDVICKVLRNKGADDGTMAFIGALLDSKEGEAAVAGLLAALLHFGPQYMPVPEAIKADPRVKRLAKEYGTKASAEGMTLVYKELMTVALPVFAQLATDLQSLPPLEQEQTRIADEESDTEEEAEKTVSKRQKA